MKILLVTLLCCTVAGIFGEVPTEKRPWKPKIVKSSVLALKVAARLDQDLRDLGISSKEIVAEARKNPKKFLSPVPEHTRKRLIVILPQHEKIISDSLIKELENAVAIYSDPRAEEKIKKIFQKLQKGFPRKLSSRIFLLNESSINAFCLPDGTVLVTKGAIRTLSEKHLTAVLAHETGHAFARHGAENITKMLMKNAAEVYADQKIMESINQGRHVRGMLLKLAYGLGSQYGFMLPYSRKMEFEADELAVIFLRRAGFDPLLLADSLAALEANQTIQSPEFLSTHPSTPKRIENIRAFVKKLNENEQNQLP